MDESKIKYFQGELSIASESSVINVFPDCIHYYSEDRNRKIISYHKYDGVGVIKWYYLGVFHREDGPASIYANGYIAWYLNGIRFDSKESWFEALTEEQKEKALYSKSFLEG